MAVSAPELVVVNPATLAEVGRVDVTPPEDVETAVAEAVRAQRRWRRSEAPAVLAAVAARLVDHADEVAATITAETGRPLVESYTIDIFTALENLAWLTRRAPRALSNERVEAPVWLRHKRPRVVYEPLGVVGVIGPWNVPLAIPLAQAAAAIAAGNAVVVKASERTPLTGVWIERLFADAGAPEGLVRVVHGAGQTGEALVRAEGVRKVLFTGSTETGRAVAIAAAERFCPVVLELGGKDPMLVFSDADMPRAAQGAVWAAFANCGQVCAGVERIYVEEPVFEQFVDELVCRARELRIGRGDDLETDLGPLIAGDERARVEQLVRDALEDGGELLAGGSRPDIGLPGWFLEPTVIIGDRMPDLEAFGPVVSVQPFADEDDAVSRANASRFGLGASIWTRDLARAHRLGSALEAGMVWTNDHAYSYGVGAAPWGGRGDSGWGRTNARQGLRELIQPKLVDADTGRVGVPWWHPYDTTGPAAFHGLMEVLYRRGLRAKATAAWRHRHALRALGARYVSRP